MSTKRFVDVAPAIPLPIGKSQTFTYELKSDQESDQYSLVDIPVGRRRVLGVVMNTHTKVPPYRTKSVLRIYPVKLSQTQIDFALWIAHSMQGSLGFTLRLFFPPSGRTKETPEAKKKKAKGKKSVTTEALVEAKDATRWKAIQDRAKKAVKKGHQVLIIVPEIWMADALASSFGKTMNVSTYHADRTAAQQTEVWKDIYANKPLIVVGSQKALFLPFQSLGLIVVEEESYAAHKLWDQYPRLQNGYGARELQQIHSADLIYASSFPSLRLHHELEEKKISAIHTKPINLNVSVIGSSIEDRRGKLLLPREFTDTLKTWMRKKERVLMLYNQRGSWQSAKCRACSHTVQCPDCKVAMVVHTEGSKRKLVCHQCGKEQPVPKKCSACKKGSLRFMGVGSEVVENVLDQLVVINKNVIRIDTDTIAHSTPEDIAQDISDHRIVLGTSALFAQVKQQQFDRVVWLFPERGLLYPDFRSYERSMALLSRLHKYVKKKHPVVLVTRRKDTVQDTLGASADTYYKKQLAERRRLIYPPYGDLVRLTVASSKAENAEQRARNLRTQVEQRIGKTSKIQVRGPFQAFRSMRQQKSEVHVLLQGPLEQMVPVYEGLSIDSVDLDPQRVL